MKKLDLKKLIKEVLREMKPSDSDRFSTDGGKTWLIGKPPDATPKKDLQNKTLEPNNPGNNFRSGDVNLSISNFSTHKLQVSTKNVTGVIFVDIRDA